MSMSRGYTVELGKYLGDHVIPVTRQTAKSIQGFIEEPVLILVKSWVTHGRANDSDFIIWKGSLTKFIPTITLLENPLITDSFVSEQV